MRLSDLVDDLVSVVGAAGIKRAVGVAAIAASLVSTYHRIHLDQKQLAEIDADTEEAANTANRSPASFVEVPAQSVTSQIVRPPARAESQNSLAADERTEQETTVSTTTTTTTGSFLQAIGAQSVSRSASTTSSPSSSKPVPTTVQQNADGSYAVGGPPGTVVSIGGGISPQNTNTATNTNSGTTPVSTGGGGGGGGAVAPVVADTAFLFSTISFSGTESGVGSSDDVSASGVTGGTDPLLDDL